MSYTHRAVCSSSRKDISKRRRERKREEEERGGYINSCTSSPKGLSRASVVCPLTALANKMEKTALLMQIPSFMTHCSEHVCLNEYLKTTIHHRDCFELLKLFIIIYFITRFVKDLSTA